MNVATTALSAGVRDEGDIVERPAVEYLWSDLKARRKALGLHPEDLAPPLGLDLNRYRTYETGGGGGQSRTGSGQRVDRDGSLCRR